MDVISAVLRSSLELGFIYGIAVLGLVMSFRITGFADLTMEGSFTTGAAVTAVFIDKGFDPFIALLIGVLCGSLTGLCTGLLHTKAGVSKLLSGIIMMTVLYSLNLRIMGKPNYSILGKGTIFTAFTSATSKIVFACIMSTAIVALLLWFLRTEFGMTLRATGENPSVVTKLGSNRGTFIIAGLMVSNSIISLAGGVVAQNNGFADIGMGIGLIITALAALMIGEALLPPINVFRLLLCAVLGSIIYQLVIATGLRMGISPWDLKFATGVMLAMAVLMKKYIRRREASCNIGCQSL